MNMRLLSAAALPVEIFPGLSASAGVSLWIGPAIFCSSQRFPGRRIKNARDLRAVIALALNIQSRPNDFGTIPHDTNTHAALALRSEERRVGKKCRAPVL